MTMVASFMPSLAFAGVETTTQPVDPLDAVSNHTFLEQTTDFTVNAKGEAVVSSSSTATQADVDKYVEVVKAPTCTENGSVIIKCMKESSNGLCDATKTETVTALGHSTPKKEVLVTVEEYAKMMQEAKAAGYKNDKQVATKIKELKDADVCRIEADVCTRCGAVDTTPLASGDKKTHEHPSTEANDCKATTNCGVCGTTIDKTTRALHSYESAIDTLSSTAVPTSKKTLCGNAVKKTYTCSSCGATKVVVDGTPTCRVFKSSVETETVGTIVYKKGTSVVIKDGSTVTPGYMESDVANKYFVADTTVTEGATDYYGYTCADCGNVVKGDAKTVAGHKHSLTKVTVIEPTCTNAGTEAYYCSECGLYTATNDVDAPGNADAEAVDFTAKDAKGVDVVAPGHKYVVNKVDATCAVPAHYEISCANCKDNAADKYVKKYVTFTTDPAKASYYLHTDGSVNGTSTSIKDIELPYLDPAVKNHAFTKKVVLKAATCEVGEIAGYKCDTCGKMNVHNVGEVKGTALGHKPVKTVVPATCGTAAQESTKCENCGYYYNGTEYVENFVGTPVAGSKPVVAPNAKCTYTKWTTLVAPTVFEEGTEAATCSVCGDVNTTIVNKIDKLSVAKASNTVKAGKKSLNVKSSAANATGYRVYYKKAGAKSWKSYTKKTASLSKTFSGLSKGKYYVKVKAYAKNYAGDGEVVWGAYSATKTVKVK